LLKLISNICNHRNATPFWNKAKPIVEGMRTRPHIYENFELLNNKIETKLEKIEEQNSGTR
jgi:hypothetical protein